ncbi:MAG: bifunctional ornithine acetyltransferase/N-acetylglutamate synthase, partial [Alcanivorax sp.]|nr:bifunctional ornithine acetyltransferase/N-acetylglutamate synthase [Alcanivorax sp.]
MAVGKNNLSAAKPITGFRLGTTSAGIKTTGRLDLVVMELCASANVAAVFTQNAFCAAPVQVAKQHLSKNPQSRYLMVNTGNANAGTGEPGIRDALSCCQALAGQTDSDIEEVLPFSTGVIGESLPVEKITAALPLALADLSEQGWLRAAEGIMTTDIRPKLASQSCIIDGQEVNITGIAKGAGMIKPNMATMLSYV